MNNLILDFSHVYCDERIPDRNKIHWIDCSDITECDLYCSGCAADEIWARIKPYGINGIHFLDSGNYHYVTGIITDRIDEDFVLVVFDHHTDMQKPMIDNMISCGDWAGQTLENNPYLKQLVLIGPPEDDIEQIYYRDGQGKLLTFSAEEIKSWKDKNKIAGIISNLPVYISIDKDVLGLKYSETNWSQGMMSLPVLENILSYFMQNDRIIGIDICGECDPGMPLPEYSESELVNAGTNKKLFDFLTQYINTRMVHKEG